MIIDKDTIARDLAPFTDPATQLRVTTGSSGCRFQLARHGTEQDYFLTFSNENIVARHANNRKYLSLRSLLASPEFADIRGLATTQFRMHKDLDVDSLISPEGQFDGRPLAMQTLVRALNPRSAQASGEEGISVLLLDGPAGVGKTSLVQRLLVQRARTQQDSAAAPPILHVTSRGRRLTALDEALAQSIQVLRAAFTFDQVPTLIRHNLIQLAIDGFDELVDPEGYKDAWYALRDFFDTTEFGGPIILAGRDTFFDEQSFTKQMQQSKHRFRLSHARLGPVSVSSAKTWLSSRGWQDSDLNDSYTALVLRPGSYTLRPYFLCELANAKSWKAIASKDLTPRAYLVEKFVEREAKLISETLSVEPESIQSRLREIFEETAMEMADNETEVVDLSFLQMVTEVAFADYLSSTDIAKLRHKAGSFALLVSDSREGFRRFPHTEISHHFLAHALVRMVSMRTPVRFLRRGIITSDFLTILGETLCSAELSAARGFANGLERLYSDEATFDRLAENSAALTLTSLCRDVELGVRYCRDMQVSTAVLFGLIAPAILESVRIQLLDAQEASFTQVEFRDCAIVSLHVDETVRFGRTVPIVHQMHLHKSNGSVVEMFDPAEIATWLSSHSEPAVPSLKTNDNALRLLDRVCRIMLRQHVIKDHETDDSGKVLRSPYWPAIERILTDAGLLDRVSGKQMSGAHAPFLRLHHPYKLLANKSNASVAKVWTKVSQIPE